jgi:hypothetical protein
MPRFFSPGGTALTQTPPLVVDARDANQMVIPQQCGIAKRKLMLGSGNDNLAKKLRMSCIVQTKFVTSTSLDPGRVT